MLCSFCYPVWFPHQQYQHLLSSLQKQRLSGWANPRPKESESACWKDPEATCGTLKWEKTGLEQPGRGRVRKRKAIYEFIAIIQAIGNEKQKTTTALSLSRVAIPQVKTRCILRLSLFWEHIYWTSGLSLETLDTESLVPLSSIISFSSICCGPSFP